MATTKYGEDCFLNEGQRPNICLHPTRDIAVIVYSKWDSLLYSRVGSVNRQQRSINWSEPYQYDRGRYPSVDFFSCGDALYVAEVHRSPAFNNCYYRVGLVNDREMSINWGICGRSVYLGHGTKPKICAKEDGTVVIIKEKTYVKNKINYHVGRVNVTGRRIVGIEHCKPIDEMRGVQPDIAINERNHVVVVWRDGQTGLQYMTGTLKADASAVDWEGSHNYDTGTDPTVSINNNDQVVSFYQTKLFRRVSVRVGVFNERSITWNERPWRTPVYSYGMHPSVSLSDSGFYLEIHESNIKRNVFYSKGEPLTNEAAN